MCREVPKDPSRDFVVELSRLITESCFEWPCGTGDVSPGGALSSELADFGDWPGALRTPLFVG